MAGFVADTPYIFAVAATNAAGSGPSAASSTVVVEQDDFAAVLSPAQDVADGEVLTATVTRTAPGLDLSEVQWAWCADGAPLDPMVQGKSVGTSLLVTPPYSHYCAASGLSSSAPPTTEPIAAPANWTGITRRLAATW